MGPHLSTDEDRRLNVLAAEQIEGYRPIGNGWWRCPSEYETQEIPLYEYDYFATEILENCIRLRGLQATYLEALRHIVESEPPAVPHTDSTTGPTEALGMKRIFLLVTASPRQRRDAALRACGVVLDDGTSGRSTACGSS